VHLPSGAKTRKECALTLNAGKHVPMMASNDNRFGVLQPWLQ
jgi:hypothetical protein